MKSTLLTILDFYDTENGNAPSSNTHARLQTDHRDRRIRREDPRRVCVHASRANTRSERRDIPAALRIGRTPRPRPNARDTDQRGTLHSQPHTRFPSSQLTTHRGTQIHPRLEEQLLAALATLPPLLDAARTAHADVLALTLEAALLKLSVLRARAHIALYGHAAPTNPRATMARALAAAQEKLRAKQRAQEDEERALDAQLAAYEGALGLVGGREGGFAQLVEDMARVRRETEECRKDLRRLGWTGD